MVPGTIRTADRSNQCDSPKVTVRAKIDAALVRRAGDGAPENSGSEEDVPCQHDLSRLLQWNLKPWELHYDWTKNGGQPQFGFANGDGKSAVPDFARCLRRS